MSRDLRLDALRGLLLVAMTADHVSRFKAPSIGLSGYVTPAEGFVFISGLVAGMVYGKAAATRPFGELRGKAFRRALVVYGTQFSVYLFVLVLFLLTGGWGGHWTPLAPLFGTSPALSVLLGGTLLYQPSHFDILPMYVPFLVLTPYAVRACLGGKSSVVWLASFSVYVLAQLEIPKRLLLAATVPLPVNTGFFDPFAWQLLFFAGLCLSAGAAAGEGSRLRHRPVLLAGCAIAAGLLFAYRIGLLTPSLKGGLLPADLLRRGSLRPLRLLNFAVVAYLVSWGLSAYRKSATVPPLAFLGRHSLQVFAFQTLLVYVLYPVSAEYVRLAAHRKGALLAAAVAGLFIPAWLHAAWGERRRNRALEAVAPNVPP